MSTDAISAVSHPLVRPELDKALLQTFELEKFYNVQEQRMILPIHYRDDWTRRTAEEAPLTFPVVPVTPYAAPAETPTAVEPPQPTRDVAPVAAQALRELYAPVGDLAGERSTVPSTDAQIGTDPAPEPAETLPYGADRARLQQLTDAILTGHEFVPLTYQYRQAGDLIPVTDTAQATVVAAQRVAAVYKAF